MVIDVFYILNELDLLEIRLNILDSYVDKFIIVESTETFSGKDKDLCFSLNDNRWNKWKDKIIHYVVDDFPMDSDLYKMAIESPNVGSGEHYWVREFYQKESVRRLLKDFSDDDIIFISDVDEIWNPLINMIPEGNQVLKPRQLPYMYYLNQRTDEDWLGWTGTICCLNKVIKNGIINHLRTDSLTPYSVIENGGWHFNSIGGKEIKKQAFSHPIYEYDSEWNRREVNMRIEEKDLPEYILNNKNKWNKFIKK